MTAFARFFMPALLVGCAAPAFATTIDFDTLPGGGSIADNTLITNQYASQGVTFQGILGGASQGGVVATVYSAGPEGPLYQRNYLGNAANAAPGNPRYDLIRVDFSTAASGVSMSLNNFSLVGRTTFSAYNASGTLLESFTTVAGNGWDLRSFASSGIKYFTLANNVFNGSATFFGIDNLNFTAAPSAGVPEPASWAMLIAGFGLAGAALRARPACARLTA